MKLQHIALSQLKPSPLNVRKHGGDDVSDLLPSIRAQGVLQPLLVRPNCEGFEVIAGGRRFKASRIVAAENEGSDPAVPCAVMDEGDDAAAIEASLVENIARLPMDEVDQYEAFAALVKEGRSIEDVAAHFGVTERLVRQRLAIANLRPAILTLYRKEEISADTMRALTLATKTQQKAWLKRLRDPNDYAPQGRQLRQWLLGGEQIAVKAAIFQLEDYKGVVVTDLFGEDAYFADPQAFWSLQMAAVEQAAQVYRGKDWTDVVTLDKGEYWSSYEYRKVPKKQGGKVYVVLSNNGEVAFHEGFLPEKELRRKLAAQASAEVKAEQAECPELTKAALNYCDLHRHAAVRVALLGEPMIALRVLAAHAIAGSQLWRVEPEQQRTEKPETRTSLTSSKAQAAYAEERLAVLALLGMDLESETLTGQRGADMAQLFVTLIALEDCDVHRILAFVIAETMSAGTGLVDSLGQLLRVEMGVWWEADEAFLGLIYDRQTLHPMLEDIAGKVTAEAHAASPAKVLRSVIRQCATGEGRAKAEGWVPPYLAFPAQGYTGRGGVPQTV